MSQSNEMPFLEHGISPSAISTPPVPRSSSRTSRLAGSLPKGTLTCVIHPWGPSLSSPRLCPLFSLMLPYDQVLVPEGEHVRVTP